MKVSKISTGNNIVNSQNVSSIKNEKADEVSKLNIQDVDDEAAVLNVENSDEVNKSSETKSDLTTQKTIKSTTSSDVQENLYDTEGTSFVYLTNTGCSRCKSVLPSVEAACSELNNANFLSVNYSEDSTLFWQLLRDAGYDENTAPLPIMIKYVDGKPVEIMNSSTLMNNKSDITNLLSDKIEGNISSKSSDTTLSDDDCSECNKVDNSFQQSYESESSDSAESGMEESIKNATSFFDLLVLVNYQSSELDFDVQQNLKVAINNFGYDSNVEDIKEALLSLL